MKSIVVVYNEITEMNNEILNFALATGESLNFEKEIHDIRVYYSNTVLHNTINDL